MRLVIAILVGLVGTATADAPPSKTLERAIKLYDKKDFYSAHVELRKVLDRESGDDAANVARAQFFYGKTLFQIGLYVPSMVMFESITTQGASHAYYTASLKWHVALARVLPEVDAIGTYPESAFEDASLARERDELFWLRAIYLANRGDYPAAGAAVAKIATGSAFHARGRLLNAFLLLRAGAKPAETIAAFAAVPPGTDFGDLAALALAQVHARAKSWDKAIATLATVRPNGPLGARAAFEASWAKLEQQNRAPQALVPFATSPVVGPDAPELAVLPSVLAFDVCGKAPPAADALAGFRADSAALAREFAALLKVDDHSEFHNLVSTKLDRRSARLRALIAQVIAAPLVAKQLAWVGELQREMQVLTKSDKAWQTTQGAANALQELTVQLSVAEATAGKVLRDRIDRLYRELDKLAAVATTKVAVADFKIRCN